MWNQRPSVIPAPLRHSRATPSFPRRRESTSVLTLRLVSAWLGHPPVCLSRRALAQGSEPVLPSGAGGRPRGLQAGSMQCLQKAAAIACFQATASLVFSQANGAWLNPACWPRGRMRFYAPEGSTGSDPFVDLLRVLGGCRVTLRHSREGGNPLLVLTSRLASVGVGSCAGSNDFGFPPSRE